MHMQPDKVELSKVRIDSSPLFGGTDFVGRFEAENETENLSHLLPQQSTLTDPADPLLLRAVIEHVENMLA
ncbi:hypothetical protein [Neptuniibacter sp.]|uniref:hypothetical protein n=1 Tax=Neptuniibacter sp. TaxID=1962643 RepID=UPI00260DD38A|nr:hypothetical protein [Neptuniibacter sp.]MCP4598267.1 hypothetical protein [Neptuniibacter sp.]